MYTCARNVAGTCGNIRHYFGIFDVLYLTCAVMLELILAQTVVRAVIYVRVDNK